MRWNEISVRILLYTLVAALTAAPTCSKPASRTTRLGLAGLIPPGSTMKDGQLVATPEQWSAFWSFAKAHGDHIAVHSPWQSLIPALDQAKANGMGATVVTSIPADDAEVAAYADMVGRASAYDVRWWCVGNEVDTTPDLQAVATRARAAMKTIQAAKPSARTCVVFQYERMLADPNAATKASLFPEADGLFFTTYPSTAGTCRTSACLPADYYAKASTWSGGKPIGFTEVGWSIDAGGESEQKAFLDRFLQSLAPRTAVIANWFTPFDIAGIAPQPPAFGRMGLCSTATACRPVLGLWDAARSVPVS